MQVDGTTFRLASVIRFDGDTTGLEGYPGFDADGGPDGIRWVRPDLLAKGGLTDLASVPTPLQWLVSRYGVYTPVALIHDRLISGQRPAWMTDVYADRYFRFMLREDGVAFVTAWMMWAAVALRTRWEAKGWSRASLVLWVVLALTGTVVLVWAVLAGNLLVTVLAGIVAPVVASVLWGRQFGAGLVMAPAIPFVLPPVVLVLAASAVVTVANAASTRRHGRPASTDAGTPAQAPATDP
jgi:hypothetical protein